MLGLRVGLRDEESGCKAAGIVDEKGSHVSLTGVLSSFLKLKGSW